MFRRRQDENFEGKQDPKDVLKEKWKATGGEGGSWNLFVRTERENFIPPFQMLESLVAQLSVIGESYGITADLHSAQVSSFT